MHFWILIVMAVVAAANDNYDAAFVLWGLAVVCEKIDKNKAAS